MFLKLPPMTDRVERTETTIPKRSGPTERIKHEIRAQKLSDHWREQLADIRRRKRNLSDPDLLVALEEDEITIMARLEGC